MEQQIPRERGNGRAQGKNQRFLCGSEKAFENESASAGAAAIALHTGMRKDVPRSGPMWECSFMGGGGAVQKKITCCAWIGAGSG